MNACARWQDDLLELALGVPAGEVEKHIQRCPGCAAAAAELATGAAKLEAALRELSPPAEPSPDFRLRVLAAAEARERRTAGQLGWAGALAAVTAVALAGLLLPGVREQWATPKGTAVVSRPSLSQWRSPTESLLRSPAEVLLRSTPRLGDFYYPLTPPRARAAGEKGGNNES
ncbi:MAG: hypothetical protein ACRD35_08900 [Candidatus Acidiferrales bacterium]